MKIADVVVRRYTAARRWSATAAAAILLGSCFQIAGAEPLRTGGTGAGVGTMRLLGDAYAKGSPAFSLEVVPNLGSGGGLKALERGAIQLAFISRPLSPEEEAKGLKAIEYGRTPFVLATARKDIKGLSLDQLAEIYAGARSTWSDGTPIRLVLRPAQDVDTAHLAAFSPRVQEALKAAMARPGMIIGTTDHDSAHNIVKLPGALGTSSLALIRSEKIPLQALAINGVVPTVKSIADGTYPHFKTLYVVIRGDAPPAVADFIAFIRSPAGRRVLADNGHWVADARASAASSR